MPPTASDEPALLTALRGGRPARTPVWFMRQAGRSLPEYREARAGVAMLDACLDPALAAEITLQPVRRHGVDAAVFFSDIVVPVRQAGVPIDIRPGVGPVLDTPVRTVDDVAALPTPDPDLAAVAEGVRTAVAGLGDTPLLGFAGAPFTLACYLVEGGPSKDHLRTRTLMHADPATWRALMTWAADVTGAFLRAQVAAGAAAVQLFDSWAGVLSAADYRAHVAPWSRRALAGVGVPAVHFAAQGGELLAELRDVLVDAAGAGAARHRGGRRRPPGPAGRGVPAARRADAGAGQHRPGDARGALAGAGRARARRAAPGPRGAGPRGEPGPRRPADRRPRGADRDRPAGPRRGRAGVSPRVVVVGGGIAGLTTALDLARAGASVTVLEASARVGGCVAPVTPDGLPDGVALDGGAESFATRTTAVADLLADVGLAADVVAPERLGAWVLHAGGPLPLPAAGLLGVPVDPWAADVRRALGVLGSARAWLDRLLPARVRRAGRADDRRGPGPRPDGPAGAGPPGRPGGRRGALLPGAGPGRGHRDAGSPAGAGRDRLARRRGRPVARTFPGRLRRRRRAWRAAPRARGPGRET